MGMPSLVRVTPERPPALAASPGSHQRHLARGLKLLHLDGFQAVEDLGYIGDRPAQETARKLPPMRPHVVPVRRGYRPIMDDPGTGRHERQVAAARLRLRIIEHPGSKIGRAHV